MVRKLCFLVLMGHLRSFGGNLVTGNSILMSAIDSASPKKLEKDIMHAPKGDLVKKVMV